MTISASPPPPQRFQQFLACPDPRCAGATLQNSSPAQLSADLRCPVCETRYPVIDGLPILVHPIDPYIDHTWRSCTSTATYLRHFQASVGTSDPYHHYADIWLKRMEACRHDMESTGLRAEESAQSSAPNVATGEFREEYMRVDVIEEYLNSAYGIYLKPMMGNREGFYATVLSAGKALPKDAAILDIGCGVGRTALDYSLLCPHGLVVGLDYSYIMLKMARRILTTAEPTGLLAKNDMSQHSERTLAGFARENVMFVAGTAEFLPFQMTSFDCVIGNYIFSIVDDFRQAIRGATQLLKPGGIFITTNGFSWDDLRQPARRHTPEAMNELLVEEGFRIELDFDFANLNTANPRLFHLRNTRLLLARKAS